MSFLALPIRAALVGLAILLAASLTLPAGIAAAEAEEKPAEEKPAEEKPAEEKPAEEKPAEEKPAEEKLADEDNLCIACHGNPDVWEKETLRLHVKDTDLAGDIHWQKGLRCHDCHGGNPRTTNLREAHAAEDGFRLIAKPADVPGFCGHCHADAKYMAKFQPNAETGQVNEFWASAHGQHLKKVGEDKAAVNPPTNAATCCACHPKHTTRAVADPDSALNPRNLPTTCGKCHEKELGAPTSAHRQALIKDEQGVESPLNCLHCHGQNAHGLRAVADPLAGLRPAEELCAKCHQAEATGLREGVHNQAKVKPAQGGEVPLGCLHCHGQNLHDIRSKKDPQAPIFVDHQVENCGQCHAEALNSYLASVHGHGLRQSGLVGTAVCTSCHGAHAVFKTKEPVAADSPLASTNVAVTCGKCHRGIEAKLQKSVHGGQTGPGGHSEKPAKGGSIERKPSCIDCHQGHDRPRPDSLRFRLALSSSCANCHVKLREQYALSLHGELSEVGYGPAANCADCHGAHDILPASDPASRISAGHRLETCRKCHPNAAANLVSFDPHADHRDPDKSPLLHTIYLVLLTFLIGTFAVSGLHTLLWLIRGTIHVRHHGRDKSFVPGAVAYVRFRPMHRIAHVLLLTSFLGLAATGLPLKYSHTAWGQHLAFVLGGFASTSVWHRIFGLMNIGCLIVYMLRLVHRFATRPAEGRTRRHVVFSPDSPVPTWRDLTDFIKMVRWFFGLGPRPGFERWAYWEKFDFWGAAADSVIIGLTGLILWFPNLFCTFLPGETVNVAKVIHSTQALLATGFVFAIHFFSVWLRPDKFPMDLAMFTGVVSEHELREERPDYYARLQEEGNLDKLRTVVPPRRSLVLAKAGGFLALSIGTALLIGMIAAALAS